MKLGFVVQRYGEGIDGGSERLCRDVAERMAERHDVEVLTTRATDYLTWKNVFPAGCERLDGVTVRRFSVDRPRRVRSFGRLSNRLYRSAHTIEQELDWMMRQGPRSTALVDHLARTRGEYDAYVFFTYLYYTTFFGLPRVANRAVLVPTLHDEPPAQFEIFRALFHQVRSFVWNTPEERALARRLFDLEAEGEIGGIGLDPAPAGDGERFRRQHPGLGDYVLYLGRIDVFKGIPELLSGFEKHRASGAHGLELVLAGTTKMKLGRPAGVRNVGFLSEEDKRDALAGAAAVVVPSAFESLSVVALEAWAEGTPVIANGQAAAVAGQCGRSGGGFVYENEAQLGELFDRARSEEGSRRGAAGREWVASDCTWTRVLASYERAIERVARA